MDIDEKRLYGEARTATLAYVATGQGLASVEISGDQVGRFGLVHRGAVRDVASGAGTVVVASDEDVTVIDGDDHGDAEATGFGPAVAVGVADAPVAADADGRVARYTNGEWTPLGTVDGVRALDGDLAATQEGVYRLDGGLDHVGLEDVRDVAAAGVPLAATAEGLYRLGNGWQRVLDERVDVVAADATHAHAASGDTLYTYDEAMGGWRTVSLPVGEPIADVAYGECSYVATEPGTFLVDADPETTADGAGGWRSRSLGLPDVTALAVVPA